MPHQAPKDIAAPIRNIATQPSMENVPSSDQQDTSTLGGGGHPKTTDLNRHISTATFNHCAVSGVLVALARNMPNIPPTLQIKILQGE